jgi:hypothetical protein
VIREQLVQLVLLQQFLDLLVQLELQVVQVPQVQLALMVRLDQLVRQEQQEQTVQQVQLDLPVQQVRQVLAQMLFQ